MNMKFSLALTYHREKSGLNMSQLADKLGVTPEYIIQIEKGKANPPSFERCSQIADILSLERRERKSFFELAFQERLNDDERSFMEAINQLEVRK